MTEDEARAWIEHRFDAQACARLERFLNLVIAENGRQNLVSPTTLDRIWSRHAADSTQLLELAPPGWNSWIDVGTGGGFPGMVAALLAPGRAVSLVEPRRKRADFLEACCTEFQLEHADVYACKIESVEVTADVISARAVASTENLLRSAGHCAKSGTTWLLPRGRSGSDDIARLARLKKTMFHVEHSVTDAESTIIVATGNGR
jgi:16S rRNA (guanine527-N7)-methyltransferase